MKNSISRTIKYLEYLRNKEYKEYELSQTSDNLLNAQYIDNCIETLKEMKESRK